MIALNVAAIVLLSVIGGVVVGIALRHVLPESQLGQESKEVIRLGTGLIATMAALVLGLLVGAAKNTFDAEQSGFQQMALNFIMLDRSLKHYGPEATPTRDQLRLTLEATIDSL